MNRREFLQGAAAAAAVGTVPASASGMDLEKRKEMAVLWLHRYRASQESPA